MCFYILWSKSREIPSRIPQYPLTTPSRGKSNTWLVFHSLLPPPCLPPNRPLDRGTVARECRPLSEVVARDIPVTNSVYDLKASSNEGPRGGMGESPKSQGSRKVRTGNGGGRSASVKDHSPCWRNKKSFCSMEIILNHGKSLGEILYLESITQT